MVFPGLNDIKNTLATEALLTIRLYRTRRLITPYI